MVSLNKLTRCFVPACLLVMVFLSDGVVFAQGVTLEEYGEGDKQFKIVEVGDKMVVYYHQRMLGDAVVEKDYIVYQFDRATGELLDIKSHWRTDLPDSLPDITVDYDHLRMIVEHEIQSFRLWIISPESDVFPLDPCPKNPCWVVRGIKDGYLVITIIDAVTGEYLGRGIPPPTEAYSLSGPTTWTPCAGGFGSFWQWAKNAQEWFSAMGYSTIRDKWPEKETVKDFVQSTEVALFYELAHGGSEYFASGCVDGNFPERIYASDIGNWIYGVCKMPFTFLGSCEGLCETGNNTFAYRFTKGSLENTVVVGYCGMGDEDCFWNCWGYSLDWQDALFKYMSWGWSVKDAFDQANAEYPMCSTRSCMRFYGDEDFAIVPKISRGQCNVPALIWPRDIFFPVTRVGCHRYGSFYVVNTDPDSITGDITESCDQFSIISGGGGFSLAPDETLFVLVRYEPSVPDTHYCTIDIGVSGSSYVNCTGVANNDCVYAQHLDFGAIALGDSLDLDFTMYNVGCETLSGIVSGSSPHYRIVSGFGSYAIPVDDSLVVTVRYKPLLIGGPWYFTVQTGDSCANVSCEGISYEPPPHPCLIEPDTLDFANVVGGFEIMTFDITNTGYGTLIDTVRSTCPNFSVMSGGAYSLTHNQTQTVSIFFAPDTTGFHECTIETGDDACTDLYCMGYGSGGMTGVGTVDAKRFHLHQNYPNPFNWATSITFTVPARSHTNLSIYDIEGRLVKTLMNGEFDGGVKTIVWNGTAGRGNRVPSGVYFYRLRAGSDVMTRKMVLLK